MKDIENRQDERKENEKIYLESIDKTLKLLDQ